MTYTVALPPLKPINLNGRLHHMEANRRAQAWREAAGWAVKGAGVPHLSRAQIVLVVRPPDKRRRDPHNLTPVLKAAVDGCVDAGVLDDDDAYHLPVSFVRFDSPRKAGWWWSLHISEEPS